MNCPTCSQTMHRLVMTVCWCPICGTIESSEKIYRHVPALVERCRDFENSFPPNNPPTTSYKSEWVRVGIAEAINVPEKRLT